MLRLPKRRNYFCSVNMPFTIRKLKGRPLYSVKGPKRTYAKATTLEKAKAQVRLLYMIERRMAKGTRRQK